VLLFTAIWLIGFTQVTYENRILLTSHYPEIFSGSDSPSPAEAAGLQDGDRIISINGKEVKTFADMQEIIAVSPHEEINLTVARDGSTFAAEAVPELNTESGSGYLGITPYIEPEISAVQQDGPTADLQPGDVIRSVNGIPVHNTMDFYKIMQKQPGKLEIEAERSGRIISAVITPLYDENGNFRQPFSFRTVIIKNQEKNIFSALRKGVSETVSTLFLTLKSIGLLFRGVDVQSAMAGPVRITYLVGDTASRGFQAGFSQGIITLLNLMAFISIALGFTNLLPIPALDGGQIMVSAYELFRGNMLSPKYYYILQIIGFSIIAAIFVFALFNDISYLMVR
jgi:regulator of sigma E protease